MNWKDSLGDALGKATNSTFFKRLLKALQEEIAQRQGVGQPLTPTQIQGLSGTLVRELMGLVPACEQQVKRLSGGPMPWDRVNLGTVRMSLQALTGISARLQAALDSYKQVAKSSSEWIRLPAVDPGNTNPSLPVPANTANGNDIQRAADALRATYQYAIGAAKQIADSLEGPNGTNPYALDGAMAEVFVLNQLLQEAIPRIRQIIEPPNNRT